MNCPKCGKPVTKVCCPHCHAVLPDPQKVLLKALGSAIKAVPALPPQGKARRIDITKVPPPELPTFGGAQKPNDMADALAEVAFHLVDFIPPTDPQQRQELRAVANDLLQAIEELLADLNGKKATQGKRKKRG